MRELTVGQLVTICGRTQRVVGFDPMGVAQRHVELEDCTTHELSRVPVEELEPAARGDVAAA